MAAKYKFVCEEPLLLWYALNSSMPKMVVEPDDQGNRALTGPFPDTKSEVFFLSYEVFLPSIQNYDVETEEEEDGRWIAEIPSLPGVLSYGTTKAAAVRTVRQLASRVIASRPTGGFTEPEIFIS